MSTRLELIDAATASEEKLRLLHEFYIVRDTWDPDDPPMPLEQRLVGCRYFGEGARRFPRWILWDGDAVAATSGVALENSEDNRDNCWGFAYVHPDHRGRGFCDVLGIMNTAPREDFEEEDLGFKPVLESRTWQGSTATIKANLGV